MARRTLTGLRVIVTGASSGIGRELVRQLIAAGASVVATARRAERLEQLRQECSSPERLVIVVGDITEAAVRQHSIDVCLQQFGGLDVLINNAGMGALGSFATSTADRLRQVMEVNFFAPVEFIRQALPHLKAGNKPLIVNISSVLGHRAVPGKSEYCASKFALHGFSDALRAELAREKVDVLLVSPSTTQSEFFEQALPAEPATNGSPAKPTAGQFGAMPAAKVARRTLRAMALGRHETILSVGGTLLVWIDRLCPPLANRLIAWFG